MARRTAQPGTPRTVTQRAMRVVPTVAVCGALVLGGACSSDDEASDEASTTTEAAAASTPSTTAESTTTAEEPTTSSTGSSESTASTEDGDEPGDDTGTALALDPLPTSADSTSPAGDGCAPDRDGLLPDGTWFGLLTSAGPDTATFGLDLACFFTGEAADAAALADDPAAEVPVPNGVYIRNESDNGYALVDSGSATIYLLDAAGGAELSAPIVGFEEAAADLDALLQPAYVWVVISGGEVMLLQQQYLP